MNIYETFVATDVFTHLTKAGFQSSRHDERLAFNSSRIHLVIPVSMAKLEAAFQSNDNYVPNLTKVEGHASYLAKVGSGGITWHLNKYGPIMDALPRIPVLECPRISLYDGKVSFFDGITRFTALRDAGFRTILVQIPREEDKAEYTAALGADITTTRPLSLCHEEEWYDVLHSALALLPFGTRLDGFIKTVNPAYAGFIFSGELKPSDLANERIWVKDDGTQNTYTSDDIVQTLGGARLLHVAYHTLKQELARTQRRS